MRTTITLDDDIFEAASAQAKVSGMRLGQVISALARRGLRSNVLPAGKDRLPVFKVPADAPIIPGSRAKTLLAEELK